MIRHSLVATLALLALAGSPGSLAFAQVAGTPAVGTPRVDAPAATDPVAATRALVRANRLAEADSAARGHLASVSIASGADSLAVADAIELVVDVLARRGPASSPEFQSLAERLVRLREAYAGPDDLRRASAWQHLASVHRATGDPRGALALYQRALSLQERVLGGDDLEVSRTLNRMVAVRRVLGERDSARQLLQRAVDIRARRLPPDHPDLALVLGNLALMDMEDGDYTRARDHFRRVLRINEATAREDSVQVGLTLLNLSTLSSRLGEPEQAVAQLERSIRILAARLGARRPEVIQGRSNLAVTLLRLGEPGRAESLFRGALADLDSIGQPDHPFRSEIVSGLAGACAALDRVAEADSLYLEALELQGRTLGTDHWIVAETLRGLSSLRLASGRADSAESSAGRALTIDESLFGPSHPSVAVDLGLRAAARLGRGDARGASRDALRAERIGADHLRATARALPERLALQYAAERASGMDLALAALRLEPGDSTRIFATWDALVRSRAIVLDEMAARNRAVSFGMDTLVASLAQASARKHEELARLFVRGVTDSAAAFRAAVTGAQAACDSVDAELAGRSASFRDHRERDGAGLDAVRAALPPEAVLVAFARWTEPLPYARSGRGEARARYFAFVTSSSVSPRAVDLGPAGRIDSLVAAWREAIAANIEGRASRAASVRVRQTGDALRRVAWDPVSGEASGARIVFLVADGALNLVNFPALPLEGGRYLVEAGAAIHVLSTERDLLRPKRPTDSPALVAFGGPAFDLRPDSASAVTVPSRTGATTYRGSPPDCDAFVHRRFEPLPGSAREVAELEVLWSRAYSDRAASRTLTSAGAGERAFKLLAQGAGTLHVATHGYFLDETCFSSDLPAERARGGRVSPLLRSGLALAGANLRDSVRADEDGILTAEEIATLDLSGTGTVTLSACDSGLGSLVAGEGVFGLRRAFEVAGSKSLVMSLWKVRDLDARRWMRSFYEARLLRKLGVADATYEATLRMLREQRQAGGAADPSAWGAFVASGDWR